MTLFNIAKLNIKNNFKQYLLNFYPMVFSIIIYFTFVSIQYNEQILNSATTIGKIAPAFMASSILLILFSSIFIWYSNDFFTRKRKKEVGLYSLYGMRKKQIARLLFYENMMIGMLALTVGVLIGTLLSKLFVMLLMKLMGFSIITTFTISARAIMQTIFAFMVIIVLTSIHNYLLVYRHSLFDLFKAEKKGERIPKSSSILAIASLLFIGIGYVLILQSSDADIWKPFGPLVLLGALLSLIIGTFLFIHSFVLFSLRKLSQIRSFYLKGVNLVSLSHLLFRIKGNIKILTVIALLSTITLFAAGTTVSLYYNLQKVTKENFPISLMYTVENEEKEKQVRELLELSHDQEVISSKRVPFLKARGDLSSINRFPSDYPVIVIPKSSLEAFGHSTTLHLGENGAISFNDGHLDQKTDPYTSKIIQLEGENIQILKHNTYSLLNQSIFHFPIVVSDSKYRKLSQQLEEKELQLYQLSNDKNSHVLVQDIKTILYGPKDSGTFLNDKYNNLFSSYFEQYQKGIETYGILIFISAFLGLIFLLATGSMLYYKQLTEAMQDVQRYTILRKIGMNKQQIFASVAKQLILVFVLPLFVAIAHSSVIIIAISNLTQLSMFVPFIITIAIYILIYFVYYFLTLFKYQSIILK